MHTKYAPKPLVVVTICLVFVLLLSTGLYVYNQMKITSITGGRDADALLGRVNQLSPEEIQRELNRIVEDGMFNISIASIVVVYERDDTATLSIENKVTNRYLMQVDISLDEPKADGSYELIYRSGNIEPGFYIPEAKLLTSLAPGEYNATATFTALYPDTEKLVGTAGAQIKLYVLPKNVTPPPPPAATPMPLDVSIPKG